jgi:hypothetical protein
MPLNKSKSDAAFRENVSEMIHAGYPRDRALAASYRNQRGHADGGAVDRSHDKVSRHGKDSAKGEFVLPRDLAATIGQGDAEAGEAVLRDLFAAGPYVANPNVIAPEVVKDIGHGSIPAGHRVLRKFIALARKHQAASHSDAA